jgi:hypothetical protein
VAGVSLPAPVALFGNKEEKAAQDAAAKAEAERLASLPARELAVEVLPAYGPEGPNPGEAINLLRVLSWLMDNYPRGAKYLKELPKPVQEANQALENAGLIVQVGAQSAGAQRRITREGEQALADGNAAKYLKG